MPVGLIGNTRAPARPLLHAGPMHDDPDSRLQRLGPDVLGDDELLAFLLTRGGPPGPEALRTSRALLARLGGLAGLSRRVEGELMEVAGIGPSRARRLVVLTALVRRLRERPILRGGSCQDPRRVYESLRSRIGEQGQERFVVLALDSRLRKLGEFEVARGAVNSVAVSVREVFAPVLREGGRAVVLAHNHPSGDPSPSDQDRAMTDRLVRAGELLDVRVVDHVVVCRDRFASMAELGLLGARGGQAIGAADDRGGVRVSEPCPRTALSGSAADGRERDMDAFFF